MKRYTILGTVLAVAVLAPPAHGSALIDAPPWPADGGVCIEVLTDGPASVKVLGLDALTNTSMGSVEVFWGADGKNPGITVEPLRTGLQARHKYRGKNANGLDQTTVWIPLAVDPSVGAQFTVQVLDGKTIVSEHPQHTWGAAAPCAAAPDA